MTHCHNPACHRPIRHADAYLRSVSLAMFGQLDAAARSVPVQRAVRA